MVNLKTMDSGPQVGRSQSGKSHTSKEEVSLMESGGGKNSPKVKQTKQLATKLFIGTYNIRTMQSIDRLIQLEEELEFIKWDFLGLCETRLPDEKSTTLKTGHVLYQNNSNTESYLGGVAIMIHKKWKNAITKMSSISKRVIYIIVQLSQRYTLQIIQAYAPTSTSEDDEIEKFYEDVSLAKSSEKTHYRVIMGDFNAKVGSINIDNIQNRGAYGLGTINDRGERLMNYLQNEKLFCMNTFFRKPEQRRWTWQSPDGKTKNEIDYIISNKKDIVKDVTVLNRFSVGSDHRLVRAKVEINNRGERNKLMRSQRAPTLVNLKQNQDKYLRELTNTLPSPDELDLLNVDDIELKIRTSILSAIKSTDVKTKTDGKLSIDTKELLKKRREVNKTRTEYAELNKVIRKKVRADIRKYNTTLIENVIEKNKNMRILRTIKTTGRPRIHQLRNDKGETKNGREEIIKITEDFYSSLYESKISRHEEEYSRKKILNVGSEILPEISLDEIQQALSQMKNGRAPGEDGITCDMIKMGEMPLLKSVRILLNKCLMGGTIPNNWNNSEMVLLFKKGDKLKIGNYRPISLLPHPYKLLTKIITNRLTNKFDYYQPVEQAGFRKGYSTVEHIQTLRTLIEKCNEYNIPLHLAFVDYNKAFDSIELWAVYKAMNNARIDSRYRMILKNIYDHATFHVKINDDMLTQKIPMKRGVRQGDTISPKLFTLALEDIFKELEWDEKGINIDGRFLNHLRFADDIVIISSSKEQLAQMIEELKSKSENVGLSMNMSKTKIMSDEETYITIQGQTIENVDQYIYLGHTIQLGKGNQTAEIARRIRMTWAATGKMSYILKDRQIPINLKRKVFNMCILPVMTYGMESMTLTIKSANKLRTTQRAIERMMLGISLRDHIRNEDVRNRTKVEDVITRISRTKWSWVGHVARQENKKWTKRVIQWRPRLHRRSVGRPPKRWLDDIKEHVGSKWYHVAQNRQRWKRKGEAYVQEWTEMG